MTIHVLGRIRGRTIELAEGLAVAEGQEVAVQITLMPSAARWGDGILRTAGALADDPYWDGIMDEIQRNRN